MNHEVILAAARKIIEAYLFEPFDDKTRHSIHGVLVTQFFHNINIEVGDVEFIKQNGDKGILVHIGIEEDNYLIKAMPHKFQQFSAEFTTTREVK